MKYFAVIFILLKVCSSEIVQLDVGQINGAVATTRTGLAYHAFFKVPYAEPPIGALRFTAPQPKASWVGVLDCTLHGPLCMQNDQFNGLLPISEDCLYLNVFTKSLLSNETQELKPVIAFLHGGGFELGSSIGDDASLLMERDVVLVTIQFRLGVFGALALETKEIPGNAQSKDQSLALKWIRQHIVRFGGDPSQVTLAGQSAGAHSVTAHMISPMSKGLFTKVIAASGAMPWQRKLATNNIETAKALALRVNCPTEPIADLILCLTEASAVDIASNMAFPFFHCPVITWRPVVENDYGQERFLEEEPNKLFSEGNFQKVKVLVGRTTDEFVSPIPQIFANSSSTARLNEDFVNIASQCFRFEANDHKTTEEIADILRKSYLPFDNIDIRSFDGLAKFLGDGTIGYGIHRFVNHVREFVDVYYYKFSYIGRFSFFTYPRNQPFGVHHVDDMQYIFNYFSFQLNDTENLMVQRMTRIWEQFAKTGDPNNLADDYLQEMHWPKNDAVDEYYLDIGTHFIEKHGLFLERYAAWDSLETSSSIALQSNALILFIIAIIRHFI